MDFVKSPIPEISISLAPPEEPSVEPYSPFSSLFFSDEDSFRPQHLTPPPTESPRFARQLSPLRPAEVPVTGKGLERERFEAMLKAARDRNAAVGAKRSPDLRKEIALKAHKSKQVERRALFLSKVNAPPSPTAISLPKTPPESPAIFHYTLPSPGLVSPLALFESLANDEFSPTACMRSREPWVEQVDFRLPKDQLQHAHKVIVVDPPSRSYRPVKPLPSLDQITARLSSSGHVVTPPCSSSTVPRRSPMRLPAFLKSDMRSHSQQPSPPATTIPTPTKPRTTLPIGAGGRPCRPLPISAPQPLKPSRIVPPKSPRSPLTPKIQITTTVVPRTSSTSPTELSEINLLALDPRARTRRDMLSALKRRTVIASEHGLTGHDVDEDEERRGRRVSAPAELEHHKRSGFSHPALSMAGGF